MNEEKFADLLSGICMEDEEFWGTNKKHHFSAGYRHKKRKELRGLRNRTKKDARGLLPLYPVRKWRTLVVMILLLILFMGMVITAKELRLKYYQSMEIQGLEDHAQFVILADAEELEQALKEQRDIVLPRYVPDGYCYHEEDAQESADVICFTYRNDDWEVIRFARASTLEDVGITTNGQEMTDGMVGGCEGVFIPDEDRNILLWSDGVYYYVVSGPVSREELLHMAESVE